MAILRKENVILTEHDPGKIKELEAQGYEKVSEEDLIPGKKKEKEQEKEDKK